MGSVVGTIKESVDEWNKKSSFFNNAGVLKIKCYRPFPYEEILPIIRKAKNVAVVEKGISLGHFGPLASDLMSYARGEKTNIKSFIVGLGGRDVTREMIKTIIGQAGSAKDRNEAIFIGK